MDLNLQPGRWKKSTRLLLALGTIWPPVYMGLFFVAIISFMVLIPARDRRRNTNAIDIDVIQLDRKIRNGEIKELIVSDFGVDSTDRNTGQIYYTSVNSEAIRNELINEGGELDANGRPRVDKIERKQDKQLPAVFGLGFGVLFLLHMITIFLMIGLLPLYIILAVKNDSLDQTMRIVWIVVFCTIGILAMPVYWYLHVWRAKPPIATPSPATSL